MLKLNLKSPRGVSMEPIGEQEEWHLEQIDVTRASPRGQLKAQTEDEFLVRIGAKEEEIIWDPKVINEKLRRCHSFVCADYTHPACYRAKPKAVFANPWSCQSPALRQLSQVSRLGPKQFYINNPNVYNIGTHHLQNDKTLALGLCFQPRSVSTL